MCFKYLLLKYWLLIYFLVGVSLLSFDSLPFLFFFVGNVLILTKLSKINFLGEIISFMLFMPSKKHLLSRRLERFCPELHSSFIVLTLMCGLLIIHSHIFLCDIKQVGEFLYFCGHILLFKYNLKLDFSFSNQSLLTSFLLIFLQLSFVFPFGARSPNPGSKNKGLS